MPHRSLFALSTFLALSANGFVAAGQAIDSLPKVLIMATGGTIAHRPDQYISGESLVEDIPELARYARLEVKEFTRIPSSEVSPSFWLKLVREINRALSEDEKLSGVVVTHGSNTVEETAYLLNLSIKDPRPVVLTAAQRLHTSLSSDGPHNLLDAVRVAANASSRGRGVMVVVNGEINSARDVTKTIAFRVETYESRDLGNLGYVDRDQVSFYRRVDSRHTLKSEFDLSEIQSLPRVEIVYASAGSDGQVVKGILKAGKAKGIVLVAFPTGDAHPSMEAELVRAAEKGIFVVATNRGGVGRLPPARYEGRRNWISGDNLTPQKARILLMVALSHTQDLEQIRRIFLEY